MADYFKEISSNKPLSDVEDLNATQMLERTQNESETNEEDQITLNDDEK